LQNLAGLQLFEPVGRSVAVRGASLLALSTDGRGPCAGPLAGGAAAPGGALRVVAAGCGRVVGT